MSSNKEMGIKNKILKLRQFIDKNQKQYKALLHYSNIEQNRQKKYEFLKLLREIYFRMDKADQKIELLKIELKFIPIERQMLVDDFYRRIKPENKIIEDNKHKKSDEIIRLINKTLDNEFRKNIEYFEKEAKNDCFNSNKIKPKKDIFEDDIFTKNIS